METFALYLFKSSVWLSAFALVFILFLRNERFFFLNRLFLIAGIFFSFIMPLVSVSYVVYIPLMTDIVSESTPAEAVSRIDQSAMSLLAQGILLIYISGTFIVALLIIRQCSSVLKSISKAEIHNDLPFKLIRSAEFPSSFSFFSFVFVNPSVSDIEAREILNHELVHVRQKHWIDLVLAEMLCMVQWFNPLTWIYIRFIRQNHEFLADEVALQRTSDPAVYKAVLLNQIVGAPVVVLANSFNYSINLKRFKMMKNKITSPYRKMKVLLILPVIAIVLYSFAKPEYRFTVKSDDSVELQALNPDQDPVKTNTIPQQVPVAPPPPPPPPLYVIDGKVSDKHYNTVKKENTESINMLKADAAIAKYGDKAKYGAVEITTKNPGAGNSEEVDEKEAATPPPPPPPINGGELSAADAVAPPPPPPPPSGQNEPIKFRSSDGKTPLIVVDGIITDTEKNVIDPNSIQSIIVLKDQKAVEKYGEKARDGVIEISTKRKVSFYSPGTTGGQNGSSISVIGYGSRKSSGFAADPLVVVDGIVKGRDDSMAKVAQTE